LFGATGVNGATQVGGSAAGSTTTIVADQAGGSGGAITLQGKLSRASVPAGNTAADGPVGGLTAAQSVDIASALLVAQTTPDRNLTLENPSTNTVVSEMLVVSIGSASFTMYGVTITTAATPQTSRALFAWDGQGAGGAWGAVQ
jgi:hypothetical protein